MTRDRWIGRARLALLTGVLAATVAAPASAGGIPFGQGPDEDDRGLHWLLDEYGPNPFATSVVCRYGADELLDEMVIRPPVVLANVAGGPRTQAIRWRVRIEYEDGGSGVWNTLDTSAPFLEDATGKLTADFDTTSYEFPSVTHDAYRVVYLIAWLAGDGTSVEGAARHNPYWYKATGPISTPGHRTEQCDADESQSVAGSPEPPYGVSGKQGKRGPHWILDHIGPRPEYPAVTCRYDADLDLVKIEIRRPIMLARDKTGGVDHQDVAWKAIIQVHPDDAPGDPWVLYDQTTSSRKAATDRRWADFVSKSVAIPQAGSDDMYFRVVYQLTWYKGATNAVAGSIKRRPLWYLRSPGLGQGDGYCESKLFT